MWQKNPVCPKCQTGESVKAGFVSEKQRYKCKSCGYHFTLNRKGIHADIKRFAFHLYLEGLGFRAISRIIGVSDVAVARWINPVKENLLPLRRKKVRLTELHRLEHFFITKDLFDRYGWLLIGTEENSDYCLLGSYTLGNCRIIRE